MDLDNALQSVIGRDYIRRDLGIMNLHYLTEKELELSREEVNLQIAMTKAEVCELLDDVREHENYIQKMAQRGN